MPELKSASREIAVVEPRILGGEDATGDGGKETLGRSVLVLEHSNVEYCSGWKISKTLTNAEVAATEDGRAPGLSAYQPPQSRPNLFPPLPPVKPFLLQFHRVDACGAMRQHRDVHRFNAIAAMSLNRVIGAAGKIPWHIPEDFKWFKQVTTGHVLLMGRKTFDSIGKPLPNRTTIVLTRGPVIPNVLQISDLARLGSLKEVIGERQIFICGGAQVYEQTLPLCSDLYLTLVKRTVDGDAFFPPFEDRFELLREIQDTAEFKILHYRRLNEGREEVANGD